MDTDYITQKPEKKYNIAVIGATGIVGREILNTLAEVRFPINNLQAAASEYSIGKEVSFNNDIIRIQNIDTLDFKNIDIAFFATNSKIAAQYAPKVTKYGGIVIDKSSHFRTDPLVPLIVPEVNLKQLSGYKIKHIIASPNCCTIPLAVALKPLDKAAGIKRVVVSTYQSVSGAGRKAMDELFNQTKAKYIFNEIKPSVFSKQIAFNLFPHIGDFDSNGYTDEETKISFELSKILGDHVKSSVTSVRVPVFVGHSMSVNVETDDYIGVEDTEKIFNKAPGVTVLQHENEERYFTPVEITGEDAVFVARIRIDPSQKNTLNLWVSTDNIRKGAALNAVQIAEALIAQHL